MERTLLLVKPDAIQHAPSIVAVLEARGFFVLRAQSALHFTRERALQYHHESMGTTLFEAKVEHVCSGPCFAAVLTKVRAVAELRSIVGPADPEVARQSQPEALRALYGFNNVRNAVNCSASVEVALREIDCVFPTAPLHVLPADEYLRETVLPGLVEALGDLCTPANVPADPYAALERWLVMNRPHSEGIYAQPVLDGHVLKYDGTSDKLKSAAQFKIEGLRNFRKVAGPAPVYGMGQCPVAAREQLVEHLLQREGHSSVTFVNMREEPVLYVRGNSCTIRLPSDIDHHVRHLAHVEAHELIRIERRLVADVLAMACRHRGELVVFDKKNAETLVSGVRKEDVLSLTDVYVALQARNPAVRFVRVPVTAGGEPSDNDVVDVVDLVKRLPAGGCVVFECSGGSVRTTMAMAMAVLVWRMLHATANELGAWAPAPDHHHGELLRAAPEDSIVLRSRDEGDYAVVKQLLALVGRGTQLKSFVDSTIELTSAVIHLRDGIAENLREAEAAECAADRVEWMQEAARYLKGYCQLMVLGAYGVECAPNFHTSFKEWHRQHWNLQRPLKKLTFD